MTKLIGVVPIVNDDRISLNSKYITFASTIMGDKAKIILEPSDVDDCSDILFIGGADIDPTLFGYNNLASEYVNGKMDKLHLEILRYAVSNSHDIFGICRGFQLLCYEYIISNTEGMVFYQNLNGHNQADLNVKRENPLHFVVNLDGVKKEFVNSMHHQAITMDNKLEIPPFVTYITSYEAPKNKIIVEGISFVTHTGVSISGVQWHPEEMDINKEQYHKYTRGLSSIGEN